MTSSSKRMPRIEEDATETIAPEVASKAETRGGSLVKPSRAVVKGKSALLGMQQPLVFLCAALGMIVMYLMREVQKLGQEVRALQQILSRPVVPKIVAPAVAQRPAVSCPVPERRVSVTLPDSTIIIPRQQPPPPPSPVIEEEEEEDREVEEAPDEDDASDEEIVATLPQSPSVEELPRKKSHRSKKRDASNSS